MDSMRFTEKIMQHGPWIDEEEDNCQRKMQKGRRKLPDKRLNEQVRAAEALNQLSIPSPIKDPSLAKQSRSGRMLATKQDQSEMPSTSNQSRPTENPQHIPFLNGLAARYVAEDMLKKRNESEDTKADRTYYEFNIEHWHLPPTFEHV